MESNSNEGTYIPQTKYDNVKQKLYIKGWKYKADENERHFNIHNCYSIIQNVKKNRKKEKDNLWHREQNIYTNYTAPLGMNGTTYLKKNKSDYKTNDVYIETITSSLGKEINDIINKQKRRLEIIEKRKPKTMAKNMSKQAKEGEDVKEQTKQTEEEIEKDMLTKAKEDKEVKKQIEQVKKQYETENILNEIKKKPKFNIDKDTQHLNDYFFNHGSENRELILGSGCDDLLDYALLSHFYQIPNEQFEKLESFYFKSMACYGGYFDNQTNIFDEIQHKLKSIKGNKKPKCFVRLLKKEYSGRLTDEQDKGESKQERHFKFLPVKEDVEEGKKEDLPSLDDIYDNPDNYFDYYYVEEDKIYKVSHDLVHNRKELIDNDLVREEAIKADKEYNSKIENEADRLNFDPFINTKSFKDALQEDIKDTKTGLIEKKDLCEEFYKKIKNSVALRNEFYKYMQDHPL